MVAPSLTVLVAGPPGATATDMTVRSVRSSEFEDSIQILVGEGDSPTAAANALIGEATGDLTILLPAGTLLNRQCLALLTRRVATTPDVSVVLPEIRAIDGTPFPPGLHVEPPRRLVNAAHHSGVAHVAHHAVDVTSSCIMLVRTEEFRRCGGFATELASSPFQVAALVWRLLESGMQVVVEAGAIAYAPGQDDTEPRPGYELFRPGGLTPDGRSRDRCPTVLWIAAHLPDRTRTGGDARHLEMIEALTSDGAEVTAWAQHGGDIGRSGEQLAAVGAHWETPLPAYRWTARPGIAPFHLLDELLAERTWSAVVVSDPGLVSAVTRRAQHTAPDARFIVDLRSVRFPAAHRPDTDPVPMDDSATAVLATLAAADGVVAASSRDAAVVRSAGLDVPVFVFNAAGSERGPAESGPLESGPLLFVGDFLHHPNVQALQWWVEEIAGLVFARAGRPIPLRAVGRGSEPYRRIWDRPDRIEVAGWQPDLTVEFERARMLLVPLPYTTGTGSRIASALGAGLPVVASEAAAAGLPAEMRSVIAIGRDARELSDHVARLATDDDAWRAACARVAAATFDAEGQARAWNQWWKGLEPGRQARALAELSRTPGTRRGPRRPVRSS